MPQSADVRTIDVRKNRTGPSPVNVDTSGRVPPHNLQAEESLLGAMLLSRDAIAPAVEACKADDFYKPAHGHIFDAILSLFSRGEPADPVTVADELSRADLLDVIGGPAVLTSLQANTPATSNAPRYATIVEEHALLRRLIAVAGEIADMGYKVPEDVTETVDLAEAMVFKIAERRGADTTASIRDLLTKSLDDLEALYERGESITGVPTGFVDLDEQLSGLQPSSLVIVGARPAMGKCVAWDTPIVDPTTGDVRTAAEIYRRGMEGEVVDVFSLDEDRTLKTTQPSAFTDDGIKPLFSVRTKLGRHVRTTLTHPFLTPDGWTPLGKLRVGARVGVPKRLPVFGIEPLPDSELGLLAYLLSDGGQTGENPTFTTAADDCAIESARFASATGARALSRHNGDGRVSVVFVGQTGHVNPVGELLRRHALLTCAVENRDLPSAVYRLPKPQMAFFLHRLLATDGDVVQRLDGGGEFRWRTASSRLAASVQHLLLRFGVSASLQQPTRKVSATTLVISEPAEIRKFVHEVGVFGQSQELDTLVRSLSEVRVDEKVLVAAGSSQANAKNTFAPTLWESAAAYLGYDEQRDVVDLPANADIRWDEVVAIDYVGDEQVYDLTVPYHHNFVAADVMVHNTSFALNVVSHAALQNVPVLYFSLEMGHSEITQRLLCSEARVDASRMRNGRLHESDWPKINHAIGRLGEAPIYIDDNPNCTVMDIRAKARRLKASSTGLGLVVVDYMQLMSGRSNAENRQVEVSEMSRGLKILARELQVPVVALSQLSRNLEQRADKRPVLADLRESGSLEQDADVVMFLYRDEIYNPESSDKGTAEIIVSKHRSGPIGTTHLAFIDRYTRFANMAKV